MSEHALDFPRLGAVVLAVGVANDELPVFRETCEHDEVPRGGEITRDHTANDGVSRRELRPHRIDCAEALPSLRARLLDSALARNRPLSIGP